MEDKCVICGGYVPEGSMVCINCRSSESNFNTLKTTVSSNKAENIFKKVMKKIYYRLRW